MFAPKGFTPIVELLPWFKGSISFWYTIEKFEEVGWEGIEELAILHSWTCIQQSPSVFVARLDGEPVEMSHFAMSNSSWGGDTCNSHFNLNIGTLGSGDGNYNLDVRSEIKCMDEKTARIHYGPLAFLPVILPAEHIRSYQRKFENELRVEFGFAPETSKPTTSYAEQITSIFRSGTGRNRDDYKARIAPDMKHEEWRCHWKEAVEMIPELAKPGPKRFT